MQKIHYAIIFLVVGLIVMLMSVLAAKRKTKEAKSLSQLLFAVCISTFASFATMLSKDYKSMSAFMGVFYVSMDWICYFMMRFVLMATDYQKKLLRVEALIRMILFVDSISLSLNVFFEHAAAFNQVIHNGSTYLVIAPKPLYQIHLIICYLLLLAALSRLVECTIQSSLLYRFRYVVTIAIILFSVLLDAIFISVGSIVDITIISFAVSAILIYYFTFDYIPRQLRIRIQDMILEQTLSIVIVFDEYGKLAYANRRAQELVIRDTICYDEFRFGPYYPKHESDEIRVVSPMGTLYFSGDEKVLEGKNGRGLGRIIQMFDITEQRAQKRQQHYVMTRDPLTGIYNRAYFMEKASKFMKARPDRKYCIICSNIRWFKGLNEVFGTAEGDRILGAIAGALIRADDHDRVYGRLDNDHFAICMPYDNFSEESFLERTQGFVTLDHNYQVINQFGVYVVEDITDQVSRMCDRAMLAIETNKTNFQRQIAYYGSKLRDRILLEQEMLSDLKVAFVADQFRIFLQPQVDYSTGRMVGAEALVRWIHPQKGMIFPYLFIPLLERNGMIAELDRMVWEMACKQLMLWNQSGREKWSIAVNISAIDFFYIDLLETFEGLIRKYDISPERLRLEITESAFSKDTAHQVEVIEKLHEMGFLVELDDFGNGYSSLNLLKTIPLDAIKLDMKYLAQEDKYQRGKAIFRSVVDMAHNIGIPIIAEGVESKEQAEELAEMSCKIIQGYFYSKPVPVTEFEMLVDEEGFFATHK